jgi:hypothetical protein
MQTLTTKFFNGETNSNTVEANIRMVGPQQPHQSGFFGRCMEKYWHTFVITTISRVKVKI